MTEEIHKKVPRKTPIIASYSISPEEVAKRKAHNEALEKRCREIFAQIYPELAKNHYDWAIMIEPNSGDYFIDIDPEVAFQKAKIKYPDSVIVEMCLNETGCVGKI